MKNHRIPFVFASVVGMSVAVFAQEFRGRGGPDNFTRMTPIMVALDTDGDGEISSREISRAAKALKSLDKDKNRKLTEDELRPGFEGPPNNFGPGSPRNSSDSAGPGGSNGRRAGGPPPGFGGPDQRLGQTSQGSEEFIARALQFDVNQDGQLNKRELGKFAEAINRRGGPSGPPRDNAQRQRRRPN